MRKIAEKYLTHEKVGSGSFGEVFSGKLISTGECVAIKIEPENVSSSQLFRESKFYRVISGAIGFPKFIWYGIDSNNAVMVIELLGKSLAEHHRNCQMKFSLRTVLMIADQLLSRIEFMHDKGFIHRDLKPDNIVTGLDKKSNVLYLIDFGLSKRYIDSKTKKHIPYKEGRSLTGTARFSSIFTHLGIEPTRRDDIESIAYILIYLLKGRLPWQGIKRNSSKAKYEAIAEIKCTTPLNRLCEGLPSEFKRFLEEARNLGFDSRPDYAGYRSMFRELFISKGYSYDCAYDWTLASCLHEDIVKIHKQLPHIVHPCSNNHKNFAKFRGFPTILSTDIKPGVIPQIASKFDLLPPMDIGV